MLHEQASELSVRLDTPCGQKTIAVVLPDLEKKERKARDEDTYAISVDAELDGEVPGFAQFWVDRRAGKRKVTVGKAAIELPRVGAKIFDLGCAPEHEVSVNGKSYGKVSAEGLMSVEGIDARMAKAVKDDRKWADKRRALLAKRRSYPLPSALIFIGEPDTCYRDAFVVYQKVGDMSGGGSSRILEGRPLHQLRSEPGYFMKEAPDSAQSMTNTTELVAVDCKSKKVLR